MVHTPYKPEYVYLLRNICFTVPQPCYRWNSSFRLEGCMLLVNDFNISHYVNVQRLLAGSDEGRPFCSLLEARRRGCEGQAVRKLSSAARTRHTPNPRRIADPQLFSASFLFFRLRPRRSDTLSLLSDASHPRSSLLDRPLRDDRAHPHAGCAQHARARLENYNANTTANYYA
jgi:hypothetical protein